jgi:hypothetical protein
MSEFLRALGYDPRFYWLFAIASFGCLLASALLTQPVAGRPAPRVNHPLLFCALLLVTMFAWRWPALFYYRPVNADEGQFLAAALTMLARGEIWWTDPTTSGPLVVLPLTLPGLFGLPVDYATGRTVGLVLTWGQVCLAYLALRHIQGDRLARLLVLPFACFATFLIFWDFVPCNSESSPLFLVALALWLGVTAFAPDGTLVSRGRLAAAGAVLAWLPFSKFQVLPLCAALGLAFAWWAGRQPRTPAAQIRRDLGWLAGGAAAGLAILLLSLWHSGYAADFYASYVVHSVNYAQARGVPWLSSGYLLRYLTGISWGFASFHYGSLLLLAASLAMGRGAARRPLVLGWLLLLAAYLAVLTPGRLYPHYLLFLSLPLGWLVGLQCGVALAAARDRRLATARWILFAAIGVGAQVVDRAGDRYSLVKLLPAANPRDQIVDLIKRAKRPGDSLAVWGWRPELYVETQLPQATREGLTEAQISDHPQQAYYRARFLADLRANRPAFFVDAIGPDNYNLQDRAKYGHEIFPALTDYVAGAYTLVNRSDSMRVYVRRDRLEPAP